MFLKGIYFERYEILKKIIYLFFMVNNLFIVKIFNFIKFFVISCKIYMYKGDINFCVIYKVF